MLETFEYHNYIFKFSNSSGQWRMIEFPTPENDTLRAITKYSEAFVEALEYMRTLIKAHEV